jgi:hypothetical protein
MMKEKTLPTMVIGLALILSFGIVFSFLETADAQECRIVRIYAETEGEAHRVRIEPQTLSIRKGACVIWNNWAWTKETDEKVILIKFREGKQCEVNTDAPTSYKLDAQSCYVSSYVKYGGTSSLRFTEEGTFDYVVESLGMDGAGGSIVVQ